MSLIGVQRRLMELGRVRLGDEKEPSKPGRPRDTFRFTSASRTLLEAVAERYGGKVEEWPNAPDEGYWQVASDANELSIMFPPVFSNDDGSPTVPVSQAYEQWAAGGCTRRCDGRTEVLSSKPCLCNPDDRECQIVTRLSYMLPEIPGLGVWRTDTHGWNAAVELPGTVEMLMMAAAERKFIPAVLRIERRTKRVAGEKHPRRFVVPVIDLPSLRIGELLAGEQMGAINAPTPAPPRPELPAAPDLPADPTFAQGVAEEPGFGDPPDPETFGDPAAAALTAKLYGLADQLGNRLVTENLVEKNRETASPGKHLEWLARQVAKAEEKVAGGVVA